MGRTGHVQNGHNYKRGRWNLVDKTASKGSNINIYLI